MAAHESTTVELRGALGGSQPARQRPYRAAMSVDNTRIVGTTNQHRPGLEHGTQRPSGDYAQRMQARIDALGLTRERLAHRARTSPQALANLIGLAEGGGGTMPSIRASVLLAHALRVHPAWLIEGLFMHAAVDVPIDARTRAYPPRAPNVEDLNYAEGAVVAPRTRFVKRWRVHHPGGGSNAPWRGVRLVCQDARVTARSAVTGEWLHAFGHLEPECASVPLPDLRPGEFVDVALAFTAPATGGCMVSRWLAVGPDGQPWADPAFGVCVTVHVITLADASASMPRAAPGEPRHGPCPRLSRLVPATARGAVVSTFAQRVLQRAKALGLDRQALADHAQLSRRALDNLLALGTDGDAQMPAVPTLLCLALALKVHPFWLVDGAVADVRLSLPLRHAMSRDRTGYVEDVGMPDGSVVQPGSRFCKVWTAQALGTVAQRERRLLCWDEHVIVDARDAKGAALPVHRLTPDRRDVPYPSQPAPGDAFSLAVNFTAPREPGVAVGCWMPVFADGTPSFGEQACRWTLVHVLPQGGMTAGYASASSTTNTGKAQP